MQGATVEDDGTVRRDGQAIGVMADGQPRVGFSTPSRRLELYSETLAEWGLQTEPFIFVIDGDGLIAAKFEGITSMDEVGAALEELLGPS